VKKSNLDYEIAMEKYSVEGRRCDLAIVLKKEAAQWELETLTKDLVYDKKRNNCEFIQIIFHIDQFVPLNPGYEWAAARWYSKFLGVKNYIEYDMNSIDDYKKAKKRQAEIEQLKADSNRKVFLGFEIGESYSSSLNKITVLKNLEKIKRYKTDSITFITSMLFNKGSITKNVSCKLRFYKNQLMNIEINCKERDACDQYEEKYGNVYDFDIKYIDKILQDNGNDYSNNVYIYKWELRHINIIIEDYFIKYDHKLDRENESDIKIIYSDKILTNKYNDFKNLESQRIKKEEEEKRRIEEQKAEQRRKNNLEKFKKQAI
jgi:hypothetical protein